MVFLAWMKANEEMSSDEIAVEYLNFQMETEMTSKYEDIKPYDANGSENGMV